MFATFDTALGDFARLGQGEVAYIKVLTPDEARDLFPQVDGIPDVPTVFAVFAADGAPLLLTDSWQDCHLQAFENDLELITVH